MWYAPYTYTIRFIALRTDSCYDQLLPLLRQFLLIPNRINKFKDLRENFSTLCFNHIGIWTIPGDLWLFNFSVVISSSKALFSRNSGSAVCVSVCLTSLTPRTFDSWEREMVLPPNRITVADCNKITVLIPYYIRVYYSYISSRPVTVLKVTDAPIHVSDFFFYLTVTVLNTVGNCNTILSIIIQWYLGWRVTLPTNFSANDFFRCFSDSANEYGFG